MEKRIWELEWKKGKKYKEELTGQVWTVEDASDDELYNEDGETLTDYFNLKTITSMTFREVLPQPALDERLIEFLSIVANYHEEHALHSQTVLECDRMVKFHLNRAIQALNLVYELERKGE